MLVIIFDAEIPRSHPVDTTMAPSFRVGKIPTSLALKSLEASTFSQCLTEDVLSASSYTTSAAVRPRAAGLLIWPPTPMVLDEEPGLIA
jgi:hypothetical protein